MGLIDFLFFQLPTIFLLQLCQVFLTQFLLILVICVVSKYKAIHANCRALILMSAFGYTIVTVTHFTKIFPFILRGDFMPTQQPQSVLHRVSGLLHEFGYFITFSTECAIVIERVIACNKQRSYDLHGFSFKVMIPTVIAIIVLAAMSPYLVYFQGLFLPVFIFCQCMDTCTVVMAFFCNRYCRRHYRDLILSSLSTKYQIREVSSLTHALVPITFFSIVIKCFIAAELWCEYFFKQAWPYMVVLTAYQTLHTLIATVWCTLLLTRHRGLRHRALLILRRFICSRPQSDSAQRRLPEIDFAGNSAHTNAYFTMLRDDWK